MVLGSAVHLPWGCDKVTSLELKVFTVKHNNPNPNNFKSIFKIMYNYRLNKTRKSDDGIMQNVSNVHNSVTVLFGWV